MNSNGQGYHTNTMHNRFPTHPPPRMKNPFVHANSPEQIELLNTLTRLQSLQIDSEFELPQIIVCGIQSSGKSSVLEAITEIPFPRKGDTCTRFITKVTLKPSERESVTVSIQPGVGSSTKSNSNDFPPITNLANLNEELQHQFTTAERLILGSQQSTEFSTDVLCVTISGPDRPILQILDLPGLITYDANPKNVNLVRDMLETEMRKPNSTILAVVAANIDPKTQAILTLCSEIDSFGHRTVGIITQPDVSPERAEMYVKIATGESNEVKIRHAWHVLRNRNSKELELNTTIEERNEAERSYLATHPWNQLGPQNLGVETLRARLSEKLLREASRVFPVIATQASAKLSKLEKELKALGGHNRTIAEMENIFLEGTKNLRRHTDSYSDGIYKYETSSLNASHAIHLRSRIVEQSELFRDRIMNEGHLWSSQLDISAIDPDADLQSIAKQSLISPMQKRRPEIKSREAEIEYAKGHLKQKRGMEMPLTWDPRHINEFFWIQSNEWGAIASEHIAKIHEHCRNYFEHATLMAFRPEEVKDARPAFTNWKTVASRVFQETGKKLEIRKDEAERELEEIEKDRKRLQINFNPRFMAEYRQQKNQRNKARAVGAFVKDMEPGELNPNTLAEHQSRHTQEDQATEVAEDFLRAAWIHYKVCFSQSERASEHS
jgi:hypothetical protein